jgi:hypothetical protein
MVGDRSYPMRKVVGLPNRWECYLPVSAGTKSVEYRYKFDYFYNEFGGPQSDTSISPRFNLWIADQ